MATCIEKMVTVQKQNDIHHTARYMLIIIVQFNIQKRFMINNFNQFKAVLEDDITHSTKPQNHKRNSLEDMIKYLHSNSNRYR